MSTQRTAAGLREMLFEQIDGIRNGTRTAKDAQAISGLTAAILASVKVEMQFRDHQAKASMEEALPIGELPLCNLPPPIRRVIKGRAQSGSEDERED